jgi:hypothetical protein
LTSAQLVPQFEKALPEERRCALKYSLTGSISVNALSITGAGFDREMDSGSGYLEGQSFRQIGLERSGRVALEKSYSRFAAIREKRAGGRMSRNGIV